MPSAQRSVLVGVAAGLGTALLWGSWSVFTRQAVTEVLNFLDLVAVRSLASAIVLAPWMLRAGISRRGVAGASWPLVGAMVLGAGTPYLLAVFAGLSVVPASHQAIISPGVIMLSTALLGRLVLKERLGRAGMIGLGLVIPGVVLTAWSGLGAGSGAAPAWGYALVVTAAILWSVFTVAARSTRIDALTATATVSVFSPLLYLPVYFALTGGALFSLPLGAVLLQAAYQGVVIGVIALVLFAQSVASLGAGRATLFTALVPGFAQIAAAALLGEPITAASVAGVALVTAGMIVAIGLAELLGRRVQ